MSSQSEVKSIIYEPLTYQEFTKFNFTASCEDCTHYDESIDLCTLGFPTAPHRRAHQTQSLKETSRVAFCRMIELD